MAPAVADFVHHLVQIELLDRNQLDEIASWEDQYETLPDLVQELMTRGWLTPYQVERLEEGEHGQLVMGPYILLEELGQGGMGRVYKARHRRLDRIVALKVINPSDLSHPEAVRRFEREAKAIARLRHPNIVLLYDADMIDGMHFLALEYVRGVNLDKLLQKGPLEIPQACDCIRQAALGLQHAHERGLVHRDIKPANLLLTHDAGDDEDTTAACDLPAGGIVKILDLGLARFSNIKAETEKLSVDGIVVGTPDYLAPEQALDSSKVDIRADIYSLGCTFYELLTGQTPFAQVNGTQKLISHIQDEPPPLETLRAGLPVELVQIVNKMMAKNPVERFQTPDQVAEVLTDLARSLNRIEGVGRKERSQLSQESYSTERTGIIRFRGPNAGQLRPPALYTEQPRELPEHAGPVHCVAFSPDGRFALSGGEDKALCLWDMNTGRKVRRLHGHTDAVLSVAFAPDNRQALSGGRDRNVFLWDVEAGQHVHRVKGITAEVIAVAFAPDGRSFLTGSQDMTLALWDRHAQRLIRQMGGLVRGRHFGAITSLVYTPDNARALSSSADGSIRLWNLQSGRELHCFAGHSAGVQTVALSADGLHLLSGGVDRIVRCWGVLSGEELSQGTGHQSTIRGVAFSPDGRHALSADENTFRVWEVTTGREVFHSRDDVQKILCLTASPDGRQVLTGGRDKFLCLWKRND